MKVPPDAMHRFLEDAKERRRRVAEAEARDAASALAREAAAIALIDVSRSEGSGSDTGSASWRSAGDITGSSAAPRGDLASGIAARGAQKLIDRVFDHLARPTIFAPWEELARSANELMLGDLARSLDRLSRARGTSDEPAWRIAVALAAQGARRLEGEPVCKDLLAGRQALATKHRVRVRGVATALGIGNCGWILVDGGGTSAYLEPSPVNAALAAELAKGDTVEFEAVLARDEVLGAVAVLTKFGKD